MAILDGVSAAPLGPTYRKLFTASALSNLADGIFQVALPLLALRITRSPGAVAGVALAARLPWLLFALQAGALADRLDRLRTMVRVDVARVVLIGGLAVVVALEHESLLRALRRRLRPRDRRDAVRHRGAVDHPDGRRSRTSSTGPTAGSTAWRW